MTAYYSQTFGTLSDCFIVWMFWLLNHVRCQWTLARYSQASLRPSAWYGCVLDKHMKSPNPPCAGHFSKPKRLSIFNALRERERGERESESVCVCVCVCVASFHQTPLVPLLWVIWTHWVCVSVCVCVLPGDEWQHLWYHLTNISVEAVCTEVRMTADNTAWT